MFEVSFTNFGAQTLEFAFKESQAFHFEIKFMNLVPSSTFMLIELSTNVTSIHSVIIVHMFHKLLQHILINRRWLRRSRSIRYRIKCN